MKKAIVLSLILMLCLPVMAFANPGGKLNVFTDVAEAEVYVDDQFIGKNNVRGHELAPGEHYLKVMYQGKKAYAEVVNIVEGQTKTVVVDNFVDFKTGAPSRGAMDKEAARLRETRGNMAFGAYGGTPASGLSFKWWMFEKFGLQLTGFTQNLDANKKDDSFGYRLLFGFADKVFKEDTITAYAALGTGRSAYVNKGNAEDNIFTNNAELAFGLELRLAKDLSITPSQGAGELGENIIGVLTQLLTLGILNTCYVSVELGAESKNIVWGNTERRDDNLTNMKVSGGIHYYF